MDYSNSCRFCLNPVDILERIHLNRKIKNQFSDLTLTRLISTKNHPNFCCLECRNKLNTCIEIKKQFVRNQTILNKSSKKRKSQNLIEIKENEEEILILPKLEDIQEQEADIFDLDSIFIKEEPCFDTGPVKEEKLNENHQLSAVPDIPELPKKPPKSLECDICGCSFPRKHLLKSHVKLKHLRTRDVPCTECGKLFITKTSMLRHFKAMHKGIKPKTNPVHCELCGKISMSKLHYENHKRSKHTGERPFQCDINGCTKKFFSFGELRQHKRIFHSEAVECPICKAKVKVLKYHIEQMHEEKKWICDYVVDGSACDKKYNSNYRLNLHIKIAHQGVRKFSCNQCSSVFSKSIHLDNHRRNVHENRRIKCELCSTLVTKKEYYRRHIILHHKELDEVTKTNLLSKIKKTTYEDLFNHNV